MDTHPDGERAAPQSRDISENVIRCPELAQRLPSLLGLACREHWQNEPAVFLSLCLFALIHVKLTRERPLPNEQSN